MTGYPRRKFRKSRSQETSRQLSDVGVDVVHFGNRDQPVISYPLLSIHLFSFHHADEPSFYGATRESGFIHKDQDINWISVRSDRLRQKSKIIRKNHARGENLFNAKMLWSGSKANLFRLPAGVSTMT
jgi:hypothetical protein